MLVVIFRATVRELDDQYFVLAARLRELALTEFGCTEFYALSEGNHEIALSYWPDNASVLAWKAHPEHILAQQLGYDKWYSHWTVEVAEMGRVYHGSGSEPV